MAEFPDTRPTLIAHVQSPDQREAWTEFVQVYRPVIYRMARRRGMQDADAQDLAQTVLAQVAWAIGRWEPRGPEVRFRHWLARVTKNAIVTALTRSPRDAATGGSGVGHPVEPSEPVDDPQDVARELELESMRERYLRAAIAVRSDVDPATWRAFELTVIDGFTCDHAAEIVGRSVGSVHAARSRVMRRLRAQIQLQAEEAP